jgi:hypothetical protein
MPVASHIGPRRARAVSLGRQPNFPGLLGPAAAACAGDVTDSVGEVAFDHQATPAAGPVPRGVETVRVIVVAGILFGVMVGTASRLAMLLLRVTSPRRVIGMRSDDDFVIGRFTLSGTYNLLVIGAAVGMIGAGVYLLVSSRLLGPTWFRYLTVGLGSAVVIGSMLVHASGVDFTQLKPTWLAIALFVALPGVFGTLIGPAVATVQRPDSWTNRGRRRLLLPIIGVLLVPPAIFVVGIVVIVVTVLTAFGVNPALGNVRSTRTFGVLIRVAWMTILVAGLAALVNDIRQLS